jgi:PAS domain S-box-containing protein
MDRVGTIIHTNDEIYRILGYQRKELIGQKINKIQPRPVAFVHDTILKRFLVNYKDSNVLNNTRQLYAISAEGYLRPISILIKLYPKISGQITMMAFMQLLSRIDGFDLFSLGNQDTIYQELPHHLMITDANGSIDCVTRGLFEEVGLSSKFFGRQESS